MRWNIAALITLAFVSLAGCAPGMSAEPAAFAAPAAGQQAVTATQVEAVIREWPEESQEVAREAIEMYGQPHEVAAGRLVWHEVGDWKRVIAYREVVNHNFPMQHIDVLEGFIDYRIPPEMVDDLTRFTGSIYVDRTKGELSARCDKEGANFLSINLAHDIMTNRRTVEEARQLYTEAIAAFMERGEMHPYMQGFQFSLPRANTADPDRATIGR